MWMQCQMIKEMLKNIQGVLLDLDGVLCVEKDPIHGAADVIQLMKEKNIPFRIATNYTTLSRDSLFKKINSMGINVDKDHIISAAYAGVLKLRSIGSPSCELFLKEDTKNDYDEFQIDHISPEVIVIGDLDDQWTFDIINNIFNKVLNGSKIIALHKGRYFQASDGLQIDSGAFIKAIEHATSTTSEVVGKPEKTFFELVLKDLKLTPEKSIMIGDDIINDVEGAQLAGIKGILVKTGKYRQDLVEKSDIEPDLIISSIDEIKKSLSYITV